jgi:hypothetical protein
MRCGKHNAFLGQEEEKTIMRLTHFVYVHYALKRARIEEK